MERKKVLPGALLFAAAFPLLFWNEGNAVNTAKGLEEASNKVIPISSEKILPENNGKLVHSSGLANAEDQVSDSLIGFNQNVIKLVRDVEMYQWVEREVTTENNKQGETTSVSNKGVRYEQIWSRTEINSRRFKNSRQYFNPRMPIVSETFNAKNVLLGAFKLNSAQINQISGQESLKLDNRMLQQLKLRFRNAREYGSYIYTSNNYTRPMVGDLRISYQVVKNQDVSVVAIQTNSTFQAYVTGQGTNVLLVENGTIGAAEMFENALATNALMTWVFRLVGYLMMFFGLTMLLNIIPAFFRSLPFIGTIVDAGTKLFAGAVAFLFSSLTIAVGWFFARPVISILLIAAAVASVIVAKKIASKSQPGPPLEQQTD
jgi:hypothetical protein